MSNHLTFGVGLLGGPKVGTTSMVLRLRNDTFVSNQMVTTVRDSCLKVIPIDSKTTVKLRVFDNVMKDNPGFTPVNLYHGISCAILVYSVTDMQSLFHVKAWSDEYERNHGGLLFMMGNKIDEEREVPEDHARDLCESIGCKKHFLVSVKTGEGIEDAFKEIAKSLAEEDRDDDHTGGITLGEEYSPQSTNTGSTCIPCQT